MIIMGGEMTEVNRYERQFKLFFVTTSNYDLELLRDADWKYYMISVMYAGKLDLSRLPKDAEVLLDNGYITKFVDRLSKNEPIPIEEKIKHSEWVINKYLEIVQKLKELGIVDYYVFDFDYFSSQGEEGRYRREYFEKLIGLFGREHVFAVFHSGDYEWVKEAAEKYGVDKLAVGSSEKDYPPYDFRALGYKWIHKFGMFDKNVMQDAIMGRFDSADISSWNSPTRFGVFMKFEMGNWRTERMSVEAKQSPDEILRMQIDEYKKALAYIDDMLNVELKALDKFYCDACPIKDKCPYYEQGGVCYIHRNEELVRVKDIEEELLQMAKEIKEKYRYEELRVKAMGMPASALELRLRDMYIKILDKIEQSKLRKLEMMRQEEEMRKMYEEMAKQIEDMFGGDDEEV